MVFAVDLGIILGLAANSLLTFMNVHTIYIIRLFLPLHCTQIATMYWHGSVGRSRPVSPGGPGGKTPELYGSNGPMPAANVRVLHVFYVSTEVVLLRLIPPGALTDCTAPYATGSRKHFIRLIRATRASPPTSFSIRTQPFGISVSYLDVQHHRACSLKVR